MTNLGDILRFYQWPTQSQKQHKLPRIIKLNFRDISHIGTVDEVYHQIEELSLNHNHLETLEGIQQFPFLKSLSINFNNIQSCDELNKISKDLRELEFKSNPKACLEKEQALKIFPLLKKLNGVQVRESTKPPMKQNDLTNGINVNATINQSETKSHTSAYKKVRLHGGTTSIEQQSVVSAGTLSDYFEAAQESIEPQQLSFEPVHSLLKEQYQSPPEMQEEQHYSFQNEIRVNKQKPPIIPLSSYGIKQSFLFKDQMIENEYRGRQEQTSSTNYELKNDYNLMSSMQESDEFESNQQRSLTLEKARHTLDVSEHIEMVHTRKRMTQMYKILMAWRSLSRRRQVYKSEDSEQQNLTQTFDSISSLETRQARQRFKDFQNRKTISDDYQSTEKSYQSEDNSNSYQKSTPGNDFYSVEPQPEFTRKQLSVLKRVVLNFLIYRYKSKTVTFFQKWKRLLSNTHSFNKLKQRVGFVLEAQSPTKKSVKNVLIRKNKKLLSKILCAWSQYVQKQQLKLLRQKEKRILQQLKIKKPPTISKRILESVKLVKSSQQENLAPSKTINRIRQPSQKQLDGKQRKSRAAPPTQLHSNSPKLQQENSLSLVRPNSVQNKQAISILKKPLDRKTEGSILTTRKLQRENTPNVKIAQPFKQLQRVSSTGSINIVVPHSNRASVQQSSLQKREHSFTKVAQKPVVRSLSKPMIKSARLKKLMSGSAGIASLGINCGNAARTNR